VGATPSTWNFWSTGPRWSEIADFEPIFARSASAVTSVTPRMRHTLFKQRRVKYMEYHGKIIRQWIYTGTNSHRICETQTLGNSLSVSLTTGYSSVRTAEGASHRRWLKARHIDGSYLFTYLLNELNIMHNG